MRTVFALFTTYQQAEDAVNALLDSRFRPDDLNLLVMADTAKEYMHLAQDIASLPRAQALPATAGHGLDALLVGLQPMKVAGYGPLYAAGPVFSVLGKTASRLATGADALSAILTDFGMPARTSQTYDDAIQQGGVVVAIRCPDERSGEAAAILSRHNGGEVGAFGG